MEKNKGTNSTHCQDSIIEGLVKFRDGKKWKSRWCVMRKLSPVADTLHLQLYRDHKDRQKNAQTKASLSLKHFLGFESGFTLDKESNTLAVLCQDLTAVLAFHAREVLIQWRVKVVKNLGEGRHFPALLSQTPPKCKVPCGPVRVHVHAGRLCVTSGVPPKIMALWEIADLRRYGLVDGKVCLEAGKRCGRLTGTWVFLTEKGEKLVEALNEAAPPPIGLDRKSMNIPRMSDANTTSKSIFDISEAENNASITNWNMDTSCQQSEVASSIGFNDSVSVVDGPNLNRSAREHRGSSKHITLDRCVSCMSHLSSTATTPGATSMLGAPWTMDSVMERRSDSDRASLYSRSSGGTSEYSIPRSSCLIDGIRNSKSGSSLSPICAAAPNIPPKTLYLCPCRNTKRSFSGPYDNYDIPKPPMPLIHEHPIFVVATKTPEPHYDIPKKLRRCVLKENVKLCDCPPNIEINTKPIPEKKSKDDSVKIESLNKSNMTLLAHTNYVNIEPSTDSISKTILSKATIDLSATLEEFESSAQILRSAGFSQEVIDELENCTDGNEPLSIAASIKKSRENILNCGNELQDQQNYMFMQPASFESNPVSYNTSLDSASENIDSISHSTESSSLSRRKSSSTEFLKRAEELIDMTKSNSEKDLSLDLNPLRKNHKNVCVNDKCVHCVKKPIIRCLKFKTVTIHQNDADKPAKPEKSPLLKLKESVKIRRSSSVPTKSEQNRDSSSSNDSGVSTGSLKHHKCDFIEYDSSKPTIVMCAKHANSNRVNRKTMDYSPISIMSNSSDPMQRISFQFDQTHALNKSNSCDANGVKRLTRDPSSLDGCTVRSPSSCGSEVSDYFETLSVSSLSSSETCGRSTARPRSGNEYSTLLPMQCALRIRPSCQCCQQIEI